MKRFLVLRPVALWVICLALVVMSWFTYFPGKLWIPVLILFAILNLGIPAPPLPGKLRPVVYVAVALSVLFTIVNFFVGITALSGGTAEIVNGNYYLVYKGEVVRMLADGEYHQFRCVEQRFWAGHLLTFAALPMLHFEKKQCLA